MRSTKKTSFPVSSTPSVSENHAFTVLAIGCGCGVGRGNSGGCDCGGCDVTVVSFRWEWGCLC